MKKCMILIAASVIVCGSCLTACPIIAGGADTNTTAIEEETTLPPTTTEVATTNSDLTEELTSTTEVETTTEPTTVTTTKKKETTTKKKVTTTKAPEQKSDATYSAKSFRNRGVIHWGNYRWTWYSERVLPGKGLRIPGRHADGNGYICDENNYICLASSTLKKGTVLDTPFGKQGKVYDSGCAAGTVDVYVNW